ncbi:protein FAR1-RELATED SEQUENCE 5-like isoform X1 [Magnolia sinica]|uniref:protein FAR1-RELATED SEQUENCE 5-like isoform X1 n=1 Tax=Magnolia sinica TaxID=86752 RepID=UPI00265A1F71|nr:protein FAR1-RELATED SEQUENCE 5-like isoform X1 [Magnolia sinica]
MWIPAYVKKTFYAGMSTTQRSEGMNAFFDYFVSHKSTLLEFAEGYDRALQKRRHNELKSDCDTLYSIPVAITSIDIEIEMAKIYTREVFYDFQVEVKESALLVNKLVVREGPLSKYNIFDYRRNDKMYTIIWNHDERVGSCTCQSFEFRGIVCRHLLVVFKEESIIKMPSHYILKRWTRNAKEKNKSDSTHLSSNIDESTILGRNKISRMMNYLINEGTRTPEIMEPVLSALEDLVANVRQKCGIEEETSIVKNVEGGESNLLFNAHSKNSYVVLDPIVVSTKGRTSKRFKSGREENSKLCRGCNKWVIGHDKRNCPIYNQLDNASEEASYGTNIERGKGKAVGRPRGKNIVQGRGRMLNQGN